MSRLVTYMVRCSHLVNYLVHPINAPILQQPGDPLLSLHLGHFTAPGLQHESVPLTSPHFGQSTISDFRSWQQPGEPLKSPHMPHLG